MPPSCLCVCLEQEPGVSSSPHVSSPENEADHGVPSSYSSLEDCGDLSRENSIHLDNAFPLMSSEATTRRNSTLQNTDQDTRAVSWIWRITERVSPLLLLREMRTLSALFYVFMMLTVLLLLASGYIGLRIIALEEQLSELSVQHGGYQQVEPVPERGLRRTWEELMWIGVLFGALIPVQAPNSISAVGLGPFHTQHIFQLNVQYCAQTGSLAVEMDLLCECPLSAGCRSAIGCFLDVRTRRPHTVNSSDD